MTQETAFLSLSSVKKAFTLILHIVWRERKGERETKVNKAKKESSWGHHLLKFVKIKEAIAVKIEGSNHGHTLIMRFHISELPQHLLQPLWSYAATPFLNLEHLERAS